MLHLLSRGIAIRDGEILLAHFVDKEYWFLPGGHIESGEPGAAALIRECDEEMAIAISSPSFLTTFEHAYEDRGEVQHELTLIYAYETHETDPVSQVAHLAFKWVPFSEFESIRFMPEALQGAISSYLQGSEMPPFVSTLDSTIRPV